MSLHRNPALVSHHSFSTRAQDSGKVLAYHNPIGPGGDNLFAMRTGSAIEAQTYAFLSQWRRAANGRPMSLDKPGDYLIEFPGPRGKLFPSDFTSSVTGKGARPDIRVALGDGYEARFDLTAERSVGHILSKGGGHWLSNGRALLIAEVFYSEDQIGEIVSKMKS